MEVSVQAVGVYPQWWEARQYESTTGHAVGGYENAI